MGAADRAGVTTAVRLALFVAGLAVLFAVSWLLGSAFRPADGPVAPPPQVTGHQHDGGH